MNLQLMLRKSGFDFIDSPVRNHKLLQLWIQKPTNAIELYYENISDALISEMGMNPIADSSLSVNHQQKRELAFGTGISILESLLASLGIGNIGIGVKVGNGKKVTISYDNSSTLMVPSGEIEDYISSSNFKIPDNVAFIKNANRNRVVIISGVIYAKNLKVIMDTNSKFDSNIEASINNIAEGKLNTNIVSDNRMEMTAEQLDPFVIAVKAHRIDWDQEKFKKLTLITDNRRFF